MGPKGPIFLININTQYAVAWKGKQMATNSLDFKVKNGLVVSTTATILGTTQSDSTTTGALIVDGGVGIQKNLYVGGTITGDVSGTATSADNLTGGTNGSIPYQNGTGTTTFLGIGNNNYVLASNGTIPTWASLSSLGAGSATTATNLAGGSAGQVPFQTGAGATFFTGPGTEGQLLVSAGSTSTGPVFTNTSSIKVGSAGTADLALTADKWTSARTITLDGDLTGNITIDGTTNVTLTATINADSIALGTDTTGIYVASGSTAGYGISGSANTEGSTFTVTSNATSSNTTSTLVFRDGTGAFSAGNITLLDTTDSSSTNTGALKVVGGAGVGGNLYLGGNLQFETEANETAGLYNDVTTGRLIFGMVDNSNIYGAYFSVFGNQWTDTTQRGGAEFIVDTRNSTTKGFTLGRFDGATWTSDFKMNVDGTFDFAGVTNINDTTDSSSTQTGALIVDGGLGIGKKLYVGDNVKIESATSSPLYDTTSGALVVTGGVAIGENINVAGNMSIQNIRMIGIADSAVLGQGALNLDGGASIGKKLNVGDILKVNTNTNATSTDSGSLQTIGGVGIARDLYVGNNTTIVGQTTITNSTEASSTITGALVVSGGVGIASNLYVGGNTVFSGDLEIKGGDLTTDQSAFNLINTNATTVNLAGAATDINIGATSGQTTIKNNTTITSVTQSVSTQTGALVVNGGVGIGGKIYVESSGTFGGDLLPSAHETYNLGSADRRWKSLYVAATTIDIGGSTIQSANGALVTEKLNTTGTQYSTSTTTGALTVVGGVGIGKNLIVGDTAASTTTVTANALYVDGGAGINGSLYVKGVAVFEQDAVFLGDTTYIFNTNTVYSDNILELHYHEGTSSWTTNDGQDIGIRMHFYDTTNTNAFFGRANDTGYLEWYGRDVSESNTGTIVGTYGTFKLGSILLVDATVSNSTNSGAFQVVGGAGIGGNLYVGGNTEITGDLAVNGGDITSTAATFNLVNTNVTTLNLANAGTAITVGATSGYTSVRNQFTLTNTTNATSTTTAALVVIGGAGVGADLHIGGAITLPNENHSSLSANVSSVSITTVDTWSTSTYRTAKYIAQISQGSNFQSAELLVVHDGTTAYITEYAIVRSNTNLGTFTADVNSNNVRLRVTMASATAATIKLSRLLIVV